MYILLDVQPIEYLARPEVIRNIEIPKMRLEATNKTVYGYQEVLTFQGFTSFTTGAIAGTRMTTSNDLTMC